MRPTTAKAAWDKAPVDDHARHQTARLEIVEYQVASVASLVAELDELCGDALDPEGRLLLASAALPLLELGV